MPLKRYVVIAAISPDGERIALLTKDKGPEELIGKVTFPGGRIEEGDTDALAAAQRELLEETGLTAPLEAFKVVHVEANETRELHVVFVSCDVTTAKTMESERVHVAALRSLPLPAEVRERVAYAPDFFEQLSRVMPDIELLRAAHAASGGRPPVAVIPCELPNFRQSLDRERPHKLLDTTPNGQPTKLEPNRRHQLVYQYTDTGDTVVVPNVWYNQTVAMRSSHTRWLAEQREERVATMRANIPLGWTEWMVENVAVRMLANAAVLREHADKMDRGDVTIADPFSLADESPMSVGGAKEQEQRDREAGTWPPARPAASPAARRMRM